MGEGVPGIADGAVNPNANSGQTHRTPDMSASDLMTAQEAAARVGVNERTIRRAIASGNLLAFKQGGAFAIARADLDTWRRSRPTHDVSAGTPRTPSPDLASPGRTYGSLPRPLTSFISRDQEIAAAGALLLRPEVRLVSLTGPGGVGKTRLAIRLASDLADAFADGVWFVPLAGVTEPDLVVDTIASTLGTPIAIDQTPQAALKAFLADRQALLVLDNLEQVIDAAPDIADLLATAPGITVLVTSRTLLRLAGEYAFPVPPLDVPAAGDEDIFVSGQSSPAVALFVERATALLPSFVLDDGTGSMVAEICRLVDGLPLALELAAARVTTMPLDLLRDRLHHQLAVLTTGMRDAPRRHRTMRDAIAWSYDLLPASEQDALRRLSVFAGGFTEDAAAFVMTARNATQPEADEEDDPRLPVVDTIASLVDQSLVRHVDRDDRRYRFEILETIRAYGLEQTSPAELQDAHERHATWMTRFVRSVLDGWEHTPEITPDNLWKLVAIEAEQDNVRASLGWLESIGDGNRMLVLVIAMQAYWELRGAHEEAIGWLERGLAVSEQVPLMVAHKAHMTIGRKRRRQGKLDLARNHYQSALSLASEGGDSLAEAQAIYALGGVATNQFDVDRAEPLLLDALNRCTALGDDTGICGSHYFLGVLYLQADRPAESRVALERAREVRRRPGVVFQESVILNSLAFAYCACDDLDHALLTARESLALWQRGSGTSLEVLAEWLELASVIAFRRGHRAHGVRLLSAGGSLSRTLGMPVLVGTARQRELYVTYMAQVMGQTAFDEAWAEGSALDPIALAHLDLDAPGPVPSANDISPATLTPREQEVLTLLAAGLRDREIADRLYISARTVEGHVARVLQKLGATSRTGALSMAIAQGIVEPGGI